MTNEELVRDYLSMLSPMEIASSIYLADINFEHSEYNEILNRIESLYYYVAASGKTIANDFIDEFGKLVAKNEDEKQAFIEEFNEKK